MCQYFFYLAYYFENSENSELHFPIGHTDVFFFVQSPDQNLKISSELGAGTRKCLTFWCLITDLNK